MLIEGKCRPKGLKRGKEKEFWALMAQHGLSEGLTKMCGQLSLCGDSIQDFKFLRDMFEVFTSGGTITIADKDGKSLSKYTNQGEVPGETNG